MSSLKKLVVKRMQQAENVLELLAIIIQSSQRTPLFLPHLETLSYSGPLNVAYVDISSDRIYFLITLPYKVLSGWLRSTFTLTYPKTPSPSYWD